MARWIGPQPELFAHCVKQQISWLSTSGRRSLLLDDGLQKGIPINCRPSMGAAVGGRSCTNPAFSSFGIAK
jgi:hypothetical protein